MSETRTHSSLPDHPRRFELAGELHARPFPELSAPGQVYFVALKVAQDAANRDRDADRAHLVALLERHGVSNQPVPGATHFFGQLGRHKLKWENHTEFTTYTVFMEGLEERPFDPTAYEVLPADWLAEAPGVCIAAALIRVEVLDEAETGLAEKISEWFVPESVAAARVLDDSAIVASDFRPDSAGYTRFGLFVRSDVGARRTGRVIQRLTEIEIYKIMALLGLPRARDIKDLMGRLDQRLNRLMGDLTGKVEAPDELLEQLLAISAELENTLANSTFRFGASGAYEAIMHDRIQILREERFSGRQSLKEFMTRRFDPAMRTVRSTENRLRSMAERAARAGDLLRTRVDVERQAQNQRLLESMDRRADLALKLQETVEGLSVVAISYYALNLVYYAAYPIYEPLGLSKELATALMTPVVVVVVFLLIRRIRKGMH